MKTKITIILAFVILTILQSCTVHDDVTPITNNTTNLVINDVKEVTISFNAGNNFKKLITFNRPIYTSDMVLVYHLYDVINGTDVWRQMPQTYYIGTNGQLDYNFDFTNFDVNIFLGANFNLNTLSAVWTQNQTFRIVVIPGRLTGKVAVNYSDYQDVIQTYQLNDNVVKNRK